jgi:hypothetical protein
MAGHGGYRTGDKHGHGFTRVRPHSSLGNLTPGVYAHRNRVNHPESTNLRFSLVEK